MAGRLVDYMGSGLASALPTAATVDGDLTTGAAGFFYATDTQTLYCLDRSGTPSWDTINTGRWVEVHTYDQAVDGSVASVDITDLAGYSEFLIVGNGLTTSASANIRVYVSVNNGSSYYSSSGDYQGVDPNDGADVSASSGIAFSGPNATAARNISFRIWGNGSSTVFGINEIILLTVQAVRRFVASSSPINAVQVAPTSGNITGGTFTLFAR